MTDPTQPLIRFGIPKGSLQDATVDLFERAGYHLDLSSRGYTPGIDDPQLSCVMFRAQEMSRYVEDGVLDAGITGYDWIVENGSDVHEVCELTYSKATSRPARWVLAVPEESSVRTPEQLAGKIVATELPNTTRKYFADRSIDVKVEFSWGATEVKARLVDAIVDVTETGSSLRANALREVDTLVTSTTRLIANKAAWKNAQKRAKIEGLATLLLGAIEAKAKVGLKLNAPRKRLDEVLAQLPSAKSPTVNDLADPDWVAVEVIVEEKAARDLIPALGRAGATAIFTYPLRIVIA